MRKKSRMSQQEYDRSFVGVVDKAFQVALDARRFEIQMYWTRTAYFSTLSAAALAGFFTIQGKDIKDGDFLSFVVSCIGALLAFGWALANKGSKFWHENWENHVQLLEQTVVGPLHKTLVNRPMEFDGIGSLLSQVLTGPSSFSVSKINSLFSWFFMLLWVLLAAFVVPAGELCNFAEGQRRFSLVAVLAIGFGILIFWLGRSWVSDQEHVAWQITTSVE